MNRDPQDVGSVDEGMDAGSRPPAVIACAMRACDSLDRRLVAHSLLSDRKLCGIFSGWVYAGFNSLIRW